MNNYKQILQKYLFEFHFNLCIDNIFSASSPPFSKRVCLKADILSFDARSYRF